MLRWAIIIWLSGLISVVPYSIYYVLFEASREEYAFYIVLPFFWVLGYWGIAGPIISIVKVRRFFNKLESLESKEELKKLLDDPESEQIAIDLIATDNKMPKFVARRLYYYLRRQCSAEESNIK